MPLSGIQKGLLVEIQAGSWVIMSKKASSACILLDNITGHSGDIMYVLLLRNPSKELAVPMRLCIRFTLLLALLLTLRLSHAQSLNVQRKVLKNGLVILALEDHTVPSVAYHTVFKVG